jgi:hypothetical protein
MNRKVRFFVTAARWFDRQNGNTYHASRIVRARDGKVLVCPLQYGYGDCYRQTALETMGKAGWLPRKYTKENEHGNNTVYEYERENGYPIEWTVSDGLKRDAERIGTL